MNSYYETLAIPLQTCRALHSVVIADIHDTLINLLRLFYDSRSYC